MQQQASLLLEEMVVMVDKAVMEEMDQQEQTI
jgi:hypothetical protein